MFLAAVYDPNVHSFYDEPLAYTDRYHKYPDFKDHKTSYRDGELKKTQIFSLFFGGSLLTYDGRNSFSHA